MLRTLLRAKGGGIVCYLLVVGGNLPAGAAGLKDTTAPATASPLGLLAGMFSDRRDSTLRLMGECLARGIETWWSDVRSLRHASANK